MASSRTIASAAAVAGILIAAGEDSTVRSLTVPHSERFDDAFLCVGGSLEGGALVLEKGTITSLEAHAVPIEIEYRVKAESADIGIGYAADEITFNSATAPDDLRVDGGPASGRHVAAMGRVEQGQFVVIRQVVLDDGMALFVDGTLRADWTADFRGIDAPVRLLTRGGKLTIDSVHVRKKPAGRSIVDEIGPVIKLARRGTDGNAVGGIHVYGEVDPKKGEPRAVAAPFDVTRDWRLDLSMVPGDVANYSQMVFLWGDTRAGKDTLYVRQRARSLEVGTWGDPEAYASGMLSEDRLASWIPISVRFDAAKKRLYLSIDGKAAADCPCGNVYFDRPMPVCLGQALGDQQFTGKLRDVVLENR